MAKEAAQGLNSDDTELPRKLRSNRTLPYSKLAIKQQFQKAVKVQAMKELLKSDKITRLRQTDPSVPSKKIKTLTESLPHQHASLLTQLITGHVPLGHYLWRFKTAESAMCPVCQVSAETVMHFLIECPAHEAPRREMQQTIGPKARQITALLTDDLCTKALFQFISRTQRFRTTHGDLELPKRDDQEIPRRPRQG